MNKHLIVVGILTTLGAQAVATTALAAPTGAFGSAEGVTVLARSSCGLVGPGAIRVKAGPGTRSEGSEPVAMVGPRRAPVVPVLGRAATPEQIKNAVEEPGWNVDLEANLGRQAHAGELLVVVFDADDAGAIRNHEAAALHRVRIGKGGCVSLRLALSPVDGIPANHRYLIQLVQVQRHKAHVLADTTLTLR